MKEIYWNKKTTTKLAVEIVKHLIDSKKNYTHISLPKALPLKSMDILVDILDRFNVQVAYNQIYNEPLNKLKLDHRTILIECVSHEGDN